MTRNQKVSVIVFALAVAVAFAIFTPGVLNLIYSELYIRANGRGPATYFGASHPSNIAAGGLLGFIVGIGLARVLTRTRDRIADWWGRMETGDKVTLFLGAFLGLIAAMPFMLLLLNMQLGVYVPLGMIGLMLGFPALSVYVLKSMDELLPWNSGRVRGGKRRGVKILDTNVLIDGRVYDVARTGFLEGPYYVPGFVLDELQYIADSHDALRRQRGRRGLDVLRHLQADFSTEIRAQDKLAPDLGDEVDARLVRLARAMGADIVTNDFNLNRVASMQQVKVLNINDLALALRPNVLPKESLTLTLIREGNQSGQGVGYLEDGTMVVVENGRAHIGETVDVTVTQVIQTERGKMIFAEVGSVEPGYDGPPRRRGTSPRRQG